MQISKKKFSAAFMLLSVPYLFLTACYSAEQKAQNAKWEEQASWNARAYIKHKYGFVAEVTGAEVDFRHGVFNRQPFSDVFVNMSHDGREFTVYINGETETDSGADDYQAADIEQALYDKINAEVSGLRLLDVTSHPKSEQNRERAYYSAYYDGSNLTEMLAEGIASFKAYYVQTDFSDISRFKALKQFCCQDSGMEAEFISCRSDEFLSQTELVRDWSAQQPVYCDNYRSFAPSSGKSSYLAYELHQYGDFYYYVNDSAKYDEGKPLKALPKIKETELKNLSLFDGYGTKNSTAATKTYVISADTEMYLHLYYPMDQIDNFDYDGYGHLRTKFGFIKDYANLSDYHAQDVKAVGDYCHQIIPVEPEQESAFVFLYDPR